MQQRADEAGGPGLANDRAEVARRWQQLRAIQAETASLMSIMPTTSIMYNSYGQGAAGAQQGVAFSEAEVAAAMGGQQQPHSPAAMQHAPASSSLAPSAPTQYQHYGQQHPSQQPGYAGTSPQPPPLGQADVPPAAAFGQHYSAWAASTPPSYESSSPMHPGDPAQEHGGAGGRHAPSAGSAKWMVDLLELERRAAALQEQHAKAAGSNGPLK